MDLNTKKQLGLLEIRNQELKREIEELDGAKKKLAIEASKLVQENEQLKAELEERKAAWEAERTCLQAQFKKLEGFQSKKTFTVLINTEVEDGLFTEPVGFTFSDYKSMDDFIQMALLHGQKNIRFTIKKGED
jgi:predicted nuclease with TOPRIM domain